MGVTRKENGPEMVPGHVGSSHQSKTRLTLKLPVRTRANRDYSHLRGNEAGVWNSETGSGFLRLEAMSSQRA